MISDNEKYILFIEPDQEHLPSALPANDEFTRRVDYIMSFAKPQDMHYKGWHTTRCGKNSTCYNLNLPHGYVTNSLAPYYAKHYRLHIPVKELEKVNKLYALIVGSIKYPEVHMAEENNLLRGIKNTKRDRMISRRIRFNEIVDSPTCPNSEVLLFMKELIDSDIE